MVLTGEKFYHQKKGNLHLQHLCIKNINCVDDIGDHHLCLPQHSIPVLLTQQYSLLNPAATGDIDNITWR
jgi:hypothetical protein